jgi:hypothetical protein
VPGTQAIVARVGEMPITKVEFDHWLSLQSGASPALDLTQARLLMRDPPTTSDREKVLDFLIASHRAIAEAAEAGVMVSDREASDALERLHYSKIYGTFVPLPHEAELRRLLAAGDERPADRLWIAKVHLLAAKLEQKELAEARRRVPRAAVAAYYRAHRGSFYLSERRDVESVITFTKARVLKAKREIESGESFASVAAKENQQPGEGGVKHNLTRRSLGAKRYEQDFFAPVKLNTLIGPLKERMYYIYEVTRIVPARLQTLAEAQEAIRQKLVEGSQRRLYTEIIDAADQRWRQKTSCARGYIADECAQPKASQPKA